MAKKARKKATFAETFLRLWEQLVPDWHPEREWRFHPERRWRFDFAWPGQKVAVEMEGGIWIGGRHTTGTGYQSDCEKYNAAVVLGWRVLRYTATDLKKRPIQVIEEVKEVLCERFRSRPEIAGGEDSRPIPSDGSGGGKAAA